MSGTAVLNFCSNDYLGLANHPDLLAAATSAMADGGFGAGAARLIAGNLQAHRELEADLAAWKHTEAALLFNSGYHANLGILSALASTGDAIYSDALNHASIIDGARLSRAHVHVYPHLDLSFLERSLRAGATYRRRIIVSESLFSMDGDKAPIAEMVDLARRYDAFLVIDEAHAAGVLGEDGAGLARGLGVDVQMGTLGKALGAFGAYAAGSRDITDLLINRARSFIFTTAMPVPVAAAARAALALVTGTHGSRLRERLGDACDRLHAGLRRLRLLPEDRSPSHIVPLILGDARRTMDVCDRLLERNIFIQGIRPPTVPEGSSRLRITITAAHEATHIDALLAAFADLRADLHP